MLHSFDKRNPNARNTERRWKETSWKLLANVYGCHVPVRVQWFLRLPHRCVMSWLLRHWCVWSLFCVLWFWQHADDRCLVMFLCRINRWTWPATCYVRPRPSELTANASGTRIKGKRSECRPLRLLGSFRDALSAQCVRPDHFQGKRLAASPDYLCLW